jgi:hypothetical protein
VRSSEIIWTVIKVGIFSSFEAKTSPNHPDTLRL